MPHRHPPLFLTAIRKFTPFLIFLSSVRESVRENVRERRFLFIFYGFLVIFGYLRSG